MSETKDGGAAFPLATANFVKERGMTLRDYFAAKALEAAVSGHISHYGHENDWPSRGIASYAYELADAMIAERDK